MWQMQCDKYNVTNAMWQMQYDKCNMMNAMWTRPNKPKLINLKRSCKLFLCSCKITLYSIPLSNHYKEDSLLQCDKYNVTNATNKCNVTNTMWQTHYDKCNMIYALWKMQFDKCNVINAI